MPYRVAFLTTHPIQYQVPVFRALERMEDIDLTVLYCQLPDAKQQGDGFGVAFEWDIPLLDGYTYHVLKNVAAVPSLTDYHGCDTPEIQTYLATHGFDAVVINGWVVKSCLQGLKACRRLGIPCIVRGEANDLRARPFWKRWLQARLVRRYAACLPIGNANRAFYLARGVASDRLFPARYCVENERFASAADRLATQREALRAAWGIAPAATCFLFSGKLIDKKAPVPLLKAFASAVARGANAHLLVVGDGPLREECEAVVRESNAPITMAGFLNQSQIVEAYVAADCLVLPSDAGETWGLVANEAMAVGRPVLVSDLAGCSRDLIVAGQTGEVIPFGDWEVWSDRIRFWSGQREQLQTMGFAAAAHIAHYTPLAAAEGIASAVRTVAGRVSV